MNTEQPTPSLSSTPDDPNSPDPPAAAPSVRDVTDAIPGAVYQYRLAPDGSERFLFLSRGVADLIEVPFEEIDVPALRIDNYVLPEDWPAFRQSVLRSAENLTPWAQEYRIRCPRTGTVKWVAGYSVPRREPDGGVLWNGVALDVTARKRADAALRDSEALYRLLAENATDVISRYTPDGVLLYTTPSCQALFGYAPEERVGHPFHDFIHPDDAARVDEARRAILAGPEPAVVSYRTRRKDGEYLWVESTGRSLWRPGESAPYELLTVTRSIAERKHLEGQFRQAQKMEAVGRLAGGVAHDFNNLLTVINGFSTLLLDHPEVGGGARGLLLEVRRAGERAADLTGQLLAFSRKQVLVPTVLDLNALVAGMETLLGRLLGEDVELVTRLAPNLGLVRADWGQLEQVLMNLAVNARDAMPDGGRLTVETAAVELSAAADVRPGPYVRLTVRDTGCGMAEEVRALAFEPFFTTKEVGQGTGLGLATVYGIVKQSGGHVEVESAPGRGSTFHIDLPRAAEAALQPAAAPGPGAGVRGCETILLAEDDAGVRQLTRDVLRRHGYTVLEAGDGPEALELSAAHPGPIHLLVTDVIMPKMNGRQLADRLAPTRPGLKVLYISGYPNEAILRQGVLDDGVTFLQKPFTLEGLARKVRAVLDAPTSPP